MVVDGKGMPQLIHVHYNDDLEIEAVQSDDDRVEITKNIAEQIVVEFKKGMSKKAENLLLGKDNDKKIIR